MLKGFGSVETYDTEGKRVGNSTRLISLQHGVLKRLERAKRLSSKHAILEFRPAGRLSLRSMRHVLQAELEVVRAILYSDPPAKRLSTVSTERDLVLLFARLRHVAVRLWRSGAEAGVTGSATCGVRLLVDAVETPRLSSACCVAQQLLLCAEVSNSFDPVWPFHTRACRHRSKVTTSPSSLKTTALISLARPRRINQRFRRPIGAPQPKERDCIRRRRAPPIGTEGCGANISTVTAEEERLLIGADLPHARSPALTRCDYLRTCLSNSAAPNGSRCPRKNTTWGAPPPTAQSPRSDPPTPSQRGGVRTEGGAIYVSWRPSRRLGHPSHSRAIFVRSCRCRRLRRQTVAADAAVFTRSGARAILVCLLCRQSATGPPCHPCGPWL